MSSTFDPEFGFEVSQLDAAELTTHYRDFKRQYIELLKRAVRVSRGSGGIYVEGNQLAYASVLFTRICARAKSFKVLLPDCKPGEHWDFSSLATLARNLLEAYFWYFWLCEDEVDADERQARFILLYCHDYGTRGRLWPDADRDRHHDEVMEDLTKRFDENRFLLTYDDRRRKEALKGHKTPFTQDEVLDRIGVPKEEFRVLYRFFSQHTHSGPVSFFRSRDLDMGSGVETEQEKRYAIMAIATAIGALSSAIEGHLKLFPDAETRSPHLTSQQIQRNVERNQGRRR